MCYPGWEGTNFRPLIASCSHLKLKVELLQPPSLSMCVWWVLLSAKLFYSEHFVADFDPRH